MSKISTVRYIRQQLFKSDIIRMKEFFNLSDKEFNELFIDGEPDGCLHGTVMCSLPIRVQIYRNGREPDFFSTDRELGKTIAESFKKRFPTRGDS